MKQTEKLAKPLGIDKIPTIEKTFDYSIFRFMNGNRPINNVHVTEIKESMMEELLFSPILVNGNREIIDGQHRFLALKTLSFPVYYITIKDYTYKQMQRYNITNLKFSINDFMNSYANIVWHK